MSIESLEALVVSYGGKVLLALIVLFAGLKLIKHFVKLVIKALEKSKIEKSLHSFVTSMIRISMNVLLVITVASMLGVEMTTFVAIIGSAGLAVGLALQGSLSNFAGGVLILLLKPFKVGDFIEAAGHMGTVQEIQIFYTVLNTPDNKRIVIPNGNLSNSSAINYSANTTRRMDLTFGAGYEADVYKVKSILNRVAKEHKMVLQDPAPVVRLAEHGDSSVNYLLRLWCKTEDYWDIHYDIIETVKLEFDREGINIPYPQMDVHLIQNK